jgi:hypothetical protein
MEEPMDKAYNAADVHPIYMKAFNAGDIEAAVAYGAVASYVGIR